MTSCLEGWKGIYKSQAFSSLQWVFTWMTDICIHTVKQCHKYRRGNRCNAPRPRRRWGPMNETVKKQLTPADLWFCKENTSQWVSHTEAAMGGGNNHVSIHQSVTMSLKDLTWSTQKWKDRNLQEEVNIKMPKVNLFFVKECIPNCDFLAPLF